MADKIYCGNGKEKKFEGGGSIISVTLDMDLLIKEYNNHGYVAQMGGRKLRIDISTRRTVGEYGDTHSVTLNTWHPDTFNTPQPITVVQGQKTAPSISEEDEIVF